MKVAVTHSTNKATRDEQAKLMAALKKALTIYRWTREALAAARPNTRQIEYERLLGYVEQAKAMVLRAELDVRMQSGS